MTVKRVPFTKRMEVGVQETPMVVALTTEPMEAGELKTPTEAVRSMVQTEVGVREMLMEVCPTMEKMVPGATKTLMEAEHTTAEQIKMTAILMQIVPQMMTMIPILMMNPVPVIYLMP